DALLRPQLQLGSRRLRVPGTELTDPFADCPPRAPWTHRNPFDAPNPLRAPRFLGVMSHPELGTEHHNFDLAAERRARQRDKALDPNAGNVGIHTAATAAMLEANLA